MKKGYLCTALLLMSTASTTSLAQDGCSTYGHIDTCPDPIGEYILTEPADPGDGSGPSTGSCELQTCLPISAAPPEPFLECISDGLEYSCTVWPQGPDLTYSWTHDGNIAIEIDGRTPVPQQHLVCQTINSTALVELTILTPWNTSSRRVFQFGCALALTQLPPAPPVGDEISPGAPPAVSTE